MQIVDTGARMTRIGDLTNGSWFFSEYPFDTQGIKGQIWKLCYIPGQTKKYVYCVDESKFYEVERIFTNSTLVRKYDIVKFDIHSTTTKIIYTTWDSFPHDSLIVVDDYFHLGGELIYDYATAVYVAKITTGEMRDTSTLKTSNWLYFDDVDMYFYS